MTTKPESSKDIPGVITLPPFIYLAGIIAGTALHFVYPLTFIDSPLKHYIGWPCVALSIALAIWSVWSMRRAGTHEDVRKPDKALVTSGPFRFSRNPIYLGFLIMYTGITILVGDLWLFVFLPFVLLIIYQGVILREERHLERVFGKQYLNYKAKTRRWI